jgi:hypothetical protein
MDQWGSLDPWLINTAVIHKKVALAVTQRETVQPGCYVGEGIILNERKTH